jgi:hypothetical protein
MDLITTVVTPASTYDLTVLANVKTDLNVPAGTPFTTSADTPSGNVLPFSSTAGIVKGQQVNGTNIQTGATVQSLTGTSVTMSAAVTGDVPAGSTIIFGDDTTIDVWLARQITLNSAAIAKYCNRQFPVETIQDQFNFLTYYYRYYLDESRTKLQLSKLPLVSVTSITVNDPAGAYTLTQGTDFMVDLARSQLIRLDASSGLPRRWDPIQTVVIYTAGFATIPSDIDDACCRMTKKAYWQRGRDPSVMERQSPGMGSEKFWVSPSPDGNLTADIADLLDNYRFLVVA